MAKSIWKRKSQQNIVLSEGIILSEDLPDHSADEPFSRWSNLLVRALFLFANILKALLWLCTSFLLASPVELSLRDLTFRFCWARSSTDPTDF